MRKEPKLSWEEDAVCRNPGVAGNVYRIHRKGDLRSPAPAHVSTPKISGCCIVVACVRRRLGYSVHTHHQVFSSMLMIPVRECATVFKQCQYFYLKQFGPYAHDNHNLYNGYVMCEDLLWGFYFVLLQLLIWELLFNPDQCCE